MNKVILYIATSQDDFIADKNGGVDWLPGPTENPTDMFGYKKLMDRVDTIVMGSKSYTQILTFGNWAWQNKHTYVFSKQSLQSDLSYISITKDSPAIFMQARKSNPTVQKDIWLLGGAGLAQSFAKEHLIDEIILTIVPQVLKEGVPLGLHLGQFTLVKEAVLIDGMVQKVYAK